MISDKIKIYGKKDCTSCETTKKVLTSKGLDYEALMLDKDYTMEDLMDELERVNMLGFRTFPLIVQGDQGFTFATLHTLTEGDTK